MDTTGKHFITKVGKILSRQKHPDRFSIATVYKPQDPDQRDHGIIYITMEILNSDPAMNDIAKLIMDTITETYYKETGDPLLSFELTLKAINEKLAALAEDGETGWIGKINAIIGVLSKNVLHLTQVGTAEAYMVRSNKITHVSEGLSTASERPHPLKTFLNIASGDLEIGDKILCSTAELFYHFSQEELRRIIAKFSPATAAAYIVKVLRKEEIESISTLVFELTTEEILSEEILMEEPDKIFLQEEKKPMDEYLSRVSPYIAKVGPVAKKTGDYISKYFHLALKSYKSKAAPKINAAAISAKKGLGTYFKKVKKESEKSETVQKAEDYFQDTSKKLADFWKVSSKPKNRSRLYIGLAAVIIIILGISIYINHKNHSVNLARDEIKNVYVDAKDKESAAKTALIYQDVPKAKKLIGESLDEINKVKNSNYLKDDINNLIAALNSELDQVNNVIRVEKISPIADFSTIDSKIKISGIFSQTSTLYTFDEKKNKVYDFDLVSGKSGSTIGVADPGTFVAGTMPTDSNLIVYIASDPENIIELDLNKKTTSVAKTASDKFVSADAIASYFNNIYLLSKKDNKIYKYSKTTDGYSRAIEYMNNSDLANATNIKVDGSVWVQTKDGKISKFLTGTRQAFDFTNTPSPANFSVTDFYAEVNLNMIYVLDQTNKRIIEFDKNGNYSKAYIADVFGQCTNIFVDAKSRKLYAKAGSQIYEISI